MCPGLQGTEDVGAAISVFDVNMAALDGRNSGTDCLGILHDLTSTCWTLDHAA